MKLQFESLEARDTPAPLVGVGPDGTLAVVLVGNGPHAAALSDVGDAVRVDADFGTWTFAKSAVKQAVVIGAANSPNFILDNLDVAALLVGGARPDVIAAPVGKATILAGGGADFVLATTDSAVAPDPLDIVGRVPPPPPPVPAEAAFGELVFFTNPLGTTSPEAAPTFAQPQFTDLFAGLPPG